MGRRRGDLEIHFSSLLFLQNSPAKSMTNSYLGFFADSSVSSAVPTILTEVGSPAEKIFFQDLFSESQFLNCSLRIKKNFLRSQKIVLLSLTSPKFSTKSRELCSILPFKSVIDRQFDVSDPGGQKRFGGHGNSQIRVRRQRSVA